MKTCFCEGKLMKQFGNPLSISEQFFHDPPLCPNVKNEIPPPLPNISGGKETMYLPMKLYLKSAKRLYIDIFVNFEQFLPPSPYKK